MNEQIDVKTYSIKNFLYDILVPIIPSIILLIVEYRTGLFQSLSSETPATIRDYSKLGFIVIPLILLLIFFCTIKVAWIRLNSRHHVREHYAFWLVLLITSIALLGFFTLLVWSYPWVIVYAIYQSNWTLDRTFEHASFGDHAFSAVLLFGIVYVSFSSYEKWNGLKSLAQSNREQLDQKSNLFRDAKNEFVRLILRKPYYEIFREPDFLKYVSSVQAPENSLAWREQARELLELANTDFEFDPLTGWHDNQKCWIGTNIQTGELICLYPQVKMPNNDAMLHNLIRYAHRFAREKGRQLSEVIVILQEDELGKEILIDDTPVQIVSESKLLDNLVNFRDYENEIKRRVGRNLPDSNLSLADVYVPARFQITGTTEVRENIEDYLLAWLLEKTHKQIAILGEYGFGKSTTALMVTHRLLSEAKNKENRVPLLIELRGMSPRNLRPLELLGAWASKYRIDPQALLKLVVAGRVILIFEGFDEMSLVGDISMRLKHFETLWQLCYPNAKMIITGRPNFFLDTEELQAALGVNQQNLERPYCESLRLMPFNMPLIRQTLSLYRTETVRQICYLAETNQRFYELLSRPSFTYLIATLWEKENLAAYVDNLTSAYLMNLLVQNSYRRQGLKETDTPGFMALNNAERQYFMRGIAAYMVENSLPNQIDPVRLNLLIEKLIAEAPSEVSISPSAITGEIRQPLAIRLGKSVTNIEHVKTDVRTCGLLIDDPAMTGSFRFGHKSIMEFLFASVAADQVLHERRPEISSIVRATNVKFNNVDHMRDSLVFWVELIGDRLSLENDAATKLFKLLIGSTSANRWKLFCEVLIRAEKRIKFQPKWISIMTVTIQARTFLLVNLLPIIGASAMLAWLSFRRATGDTMGKGNDVINPTQKALLERLGTVAMLLGILVVIFLLATAIVRMLRGNELIPAPKSRSESDLENAFAPYSVPDSELRIWNAACHILRVPDKIMHQVALTTFIPWVRDQPFDYFIIKRDGYILF